MKVQLGIHPYRPIVLLDPSAAGKLKNSWFEHQKFKIDNLRILGPHNWREVVFPFANDVPLILLDTRIASPAVIEETRRLVTSNHKNKVVFVVNDDESSPSIDALDEQLDIGDLTITKISTTIDTIRSFGLSHTQSPIENPFYVFFSSRKIEKKMRRTAMAGYQFSEALQKAYKKYGKTPMIVDASELFNRLNGDTEAGLAQVVSELESDIEATETFLERWSNEQRYLHQTVIAEAIYTCQCLAELQVALNAAPPNLIQETLEMLSRHKQ